MDGIYIENIDLKYPRAWRKIIDEGGTKVNPLGVLWMERWAEEMEINSISDDMDIGELRQMMFQSWQQIGGTNMRIADMAPYFDPFIACWEHGDLLVPVTGTSPQIIDTFKRWARRTELCILLNSGQSR